MKLYSENKEYKLYNGSMLDMLEVIEPNSIDAIITDPPYELNFMNKGWDNSGIAFQKETWEKCLKVLKPGGHLLAFGGSRTFARISVAIEDAGFEIRDTIMYLYGSGMPKSLNIGLAIDKRNGVDNRTGNIIVDGVGTNSGSGCYNINDGTSESMKKQYEERKAQNEWSGWGTQLKPAYEPIIVARKPVENSIIDNVSKYGVGGINIDECRVPLESTYEYKETKRQPLGENSVFNNSNCGFKPENSFMASANPEGRFPSNVIHDGSDEVVKEMPNTKSNGSDYDFDFTNQDNPSHLYTNIKSRQHFEDEGSASRYFYCAKASKFDRDEGLDDFEEKRKYVDAGNRKPEGKSVFEPSDTTMKNIHPTVKPVSLMRYLVRLISPKGATILDCFNGSGSTGKAVMLENKEFKKDYKYIGIELTDEYLPISKARIEYICNNDFEFEDDKSSKISKHTKVEKGYKKDTIFDFLDN